MQNKYFKKYVTYNYDQLQITKLNVDRKNEPSYICRKIYKKINNRIYEVNHISSLTQLSPQEIINNDIVEKPYSKEKAIDLLDEAFLEVEGRTLTDRNKEWLFKNYGKTVHIPYKPAKKTGLFKTDEVLEHEEIQGINDEQYKPVYCNGMLIDGVCERYTFFIEKICKDLGIKHLNVGGIGTTEHVWSLIYLPEEKRWVHFDMTMVKFYQDKWIINHEPYNMENWIAASISDIFKMQPTRKITNINGIKCSFNIENYTELDVNKFDEETIR